MEPQQRVFVARYFYRAHFVKNFQHFTFGKVIPISKEKYAYFLNNLVSLGQLEVESLRGQYEKFCERSLASSLAVLQEKQASEKHQQIFELRKKISKPFGQTERMLWALTIVESRTFDLFRIFKKIEIFSFAAEFWQLRIGRRISSKTSL